jgi:hypothetical protein
MKVEKFEDVINNPSHPLVQEVLNSLQTHAGDIVSCKQCGQDYERGMWNFYNLCDKCFSEFNKNKLMKEFDLQLALKGNGVQTRKGLPVVIMGVFYDASFSSERLVGFIDGKLHTWHVSGKKHEETTSYSDFDLFMRNCGEEKCCNCTCNRNECLSDFLGGSLSPRSLK